MGTKRRATDLWTTSKQYNAPGLRVDKSIKVNSAMWIVIEATELLYECIPFEDADLF